MTLLVRRAYGGAHILRRLQTAVADTFPDTGPHIGDVAWLGRDQGHLEPRLHIDVWGDAAGRLGCTDPSASETAEPTCSTGSPLPSRHASRRRL